MASRDDILHAVRTHLPPPADLPEIEARGIVYADRPKQFAAMVEAVGGRCVFAADWPRSTRLWRSMPEVATALNVVSLVSGVGTPNVELNDINDPHDLADVDFAVLPGRFGVAENGAVWVTDEGVKHRAIFFIAQHLALVIPVAEILDNMHQAMNGWRSTNRDSARSSRGRRRRPTSSNPWSSECHGPRSLTVFCVDKSQLLDRLHDPRRRCHRPCSGIYRSAGVLGVAAGPALPASSDHQGRRMAAHRRHAPDARRRPFAGPLSGGPA